ncbi:MAG TPA: hypothetical protein VNA31_07265, partial [bacterium]|nr:hypothetical protein [bacterium]
MTLTSLLPRTSNVCVFITARPLVLMWRSLRPPHLADIGVPPELYAQLGVSVGPLFARDEIVRLRRREPRPRRVVYRGTRSFCCGI